MRHRLPPVLSVLAALTCLLAACSPAAPASTAAPRSGASPVAAVPAAPSAATPVPSAPANAPAAVAPAQPPTKVRLGVLGSASDAGFWISLARGYFREQALDVESTVFSVAADMVAPLGAGQLDIGGGAPGVGLNNAVGRGVDIRIVADKGSTPPGWGYQAIIARRDLYESGELRGAADLRGRRMAFPSTTGITPEAGMERYTQRAGLAARDVELIQMAFPDMVAAMANRSVELAMTIEPFVTAIVENGDGQILARWDEVSPGQSIAVVLYGGEFIRAEPEAARRFMVAYLKAVRDYNDAFAKRDPALVREIVSILTQSTTIKDPAVYAKVVMPCLNPDGETNVASLKEDQEYFIRAGLQRERVDLERVVDHAFVRQAVEQLGGPYR